MNIFTSKLFKVLLVIALSSIQVFSQGNVSFTVKNAGFSVDGHFDKVKMNVTFDAAKPELSKFEGEVETVSINTDNNKRDKHLREKDYFFSEKYPLMSFQSTSVKKQGSDALSVTGKLTIRDVSKIITVPVIITKENGKEIFTSDFKIKRRDYNVGGWSLILSDELKVKIKFVR